jgi:hypothetical protein
LSPALLSHANNVIGRVPVVIYVVVVIVIDIVIVRHPVHIHRCNGGGNTNDNDSTIQSNVRHNAAPSIDAYALLVRIASWEEDDGDWGGGGGGTLVVVITASIAVRPAEDEDDDGSGVRSGRYRPIRSQRRMLHKTVTMTTDRFWIASLVVIAEL